MKCAADFRKIARNALRGNWLIAVLTGFLAFLMGAGIITGSSASSSNRYTIELFQELPSSAIWTQIRPLLIAAAVVLLLWCILTFIVGGAAKLGYAIFNLNLVDHGNAALSDLFSQFHRLWNGFCMNFLTGLFTFLWTLLLVIPGIIKSYSYAMTPYILAENPDMTATDAITESRRLMKGNKWRLFCLELSFVGWGLLCTVPASIAILFPFACALDSGNPAMLLWLIPCCIPFLIASLFLNAYQETACAAFYRDITTPTPVEPDRVPSADTTPWANL